MRTQKPDEKTFKEWNEYFAKKYNMDNFYYHSGLIIKLIEKRRVKYVADMLDSAAGDKVLEVGCGGGHILEKVKNGTLYGIDMSDFLLQIARSRLSKAGARLVSADAGSLPFKDGSFDKIICTEVIEHVLDPEKVLAEIGRVMRGGGSLVLTVPNEGLINILKKSVIKMGLWRLFFPGKYKVSDEMNEEWHLHVFDLNKLRQMLRGKFVIEKIRYVPFVFLPLRYVIKCRKADPKA